MKVFSGEALENKQLDINQRLFNDTTTWLAEALDGNMRTTFEFSFDGNEIYSQDGGSLRDVFEKSLDDSVSLPVNLGFEWRRRKHELAEYEEMLSMMKDDGFNTMIVISDFPDELNGQPYDEGGYNVSRKQTMLRVITKTEGNRLILTTQSLDGSDRRALEAVYGYFGLTPEPGELLGQRIHINANKASQESLINELTSVYDASLSNQYSGVFYAGRRKSALGDTFDFVKAQSDLIEYYMQNSNYFGDNPNILLGVTRVIEDRYNNQTNQIKHYFAPNFESITSQINLATRQSLFENKQYSGCGLSLSGDQTLAEKLTQAGYGNKLNPEQKYSFNKKMHCVVCQAPPKKLDEPKKMCGPCGICKSCDKKLSSKIG
jgi:hypothetical protein